MVFRVNKTNDYTVMSNYHLKDTKLSLKAKGLLSQMLALPKDWDYSIKGLCAINKENETAIKSALDELKECGYVVVNKIYPKDSETGRIEYEYNIYEQPKKQGGDFLGVEILGLENQVQLNTKKQNTKNNINSINTIPEPKPKKSNLFSKCISEIDNFTNDDELKDELVNYLGLRINFEGKPIRGVNQWKGLLNKLATLTTNPNDYIKIVRQSIENGWASFYELKRNNFSYHKKDVFSEYGSVKSSKVDEDMADEQF